MKAGLTKLGFSFSSQKGGHEQWTADNPYRKVTVDSHHAPFHRELFKSMANQAGVSKKELFRCCTEKKYQPDLDKISRKLNQSKA